MGSLVSDGELVVQKYHKTCIFSKERKSLLTLCCVGIIVTQSYTIYLYCFTILFLIGIWTTIKVDTCVLINNASNFT